MELNVEQIAKALECCGIDRCDDCPCYTEELGCDHNLQLLALALIRELTEENKKLTINMNAYGLTAKRLAEENERLMAEKEAAVDDLEHCMHYAKPKNNNTCNFCLNDCESGLCKGREDWIECRPVWRGIVKAKGDIDQIAKELLEDDSDG